jgi:hypothetical protein
MTAVLTAALTSLRSGFNTAFPARDKTTDGWIGDAAHQAETSGHNPDDTAGVSAEYQDADTKQEVRAVDVDKDLNHPGVTMYDVIRRILATPADVARLRYIIFCPPLGPFGANVPTIWSRNSGWSPRTYSGSSRHDEHAHFSGDPDTDEDSRPWSVASMGAMSMTVMWDQGDENVAWATTNRTEALLKNLDAAVYRVAGEATDRHETNELKRQLDRIEAALSELKSRPVTVSLTDAQLDALATTVASRLGLIPTAGEIAKAVGGLDWHGTLPT